MTEVYARTIVTVQYSTADPEKDWLSHTVYHHHSDEVGALGPFDPVGHATNVANAFHNGTGAGSPFDSYQNMKITARVYDMSQAKPRPVLGEFVITPTTWSSATLAPREVAVPLRYYAARNLVGLRGRLFIGFQLVSNMGEFVGTVLANKILNLGTALAAVGGVQTSWVFASSLGTLIGTTGFSFHDITNIWVNDQWASVKSREAAEQTRHTATVTPGLP